MTLLRVSDWCAIGTAIAVSGVVKIWPGAPYPLGATYDGAGTNFSVFSEAATRVELCLFDDGGAQEAIAPPRPRDSSGMATSRTSIPASATAIVYTARGIPTQGCAAIR